MNKRGVMFILNFMVAVFVLFLVLGYLTPFKDTIQLQRTNMNCSSDTISTGTQITCLGLDMTLWFWIGCILVAGFGVLWQRRSAG